MHVKSKSYKLFGEEPKIYLGGCQLKNVNQYTYLGHIISSDLSDDADIQKHIRLLYCRANSLIRRFSCCSEKIRIFLFNMYCANVYCSSLWCVFKQATKNRLNVAYNNCFTILLRKPRFCSASRMFTEHNIRNCDALLRRNMYSLSVRLANSTNMLVNCIYESDIRYIHHSFLFCVKGACTP